MLLKHSGSELSSSTPKEGVDRDHTERWDQNKTKLSRTNIRLTALLSVLGAHGSIAWAPMGLNGFNPAG